MPRARGGHRSGQPGRSYGNRSDLTQGVRVAPSKTYGEGAASERAQRAIPLPQQPSPSAAALGGAGVPQGPLPGANPFDRPTDRPGEPLTSGMVIGAGAGPSAAMPAVDPVIETLRVAYRAFPNEAIGALLEAAGG